MGIELVFPYGDSRRQPAAPVDVRFDGPDPATMTLPQLARELDGIDAARARLDARHLTVVAEWEQRDGPGREGAVSAAAALHYRYGHDARSTRRQVTVARKLLRLPDMAAALAAGVVTYDHADALTHALTDRTAEAMARDEKRLVRLACRLNADQFRKALRHWKAHADPDGTEPDSGLTDELYMAQSIDGEFFGKFHFGAEHGEIVKRAIDAMLDEMHRNTSDAEHDLAPAPQRRAEAWLELARRGGAINADGALHHRTRPQIIATIDHDNLLDDVGRGDVLGADTTLSATAIRRLACDADIIAAVFGADAELLDLGRRARLVSPAQRMALALRDQGCAFPSCDRPIGWCDAHHIDHWVDGGPTDLDNLCLLCSRHHHLLHEGGWSLHRDSDGTLVFTEPTGLALPNPYRLPGRPDPFLGPWRNPERQVRPPARGAPTADHDDHRPPPHDPRSDESDAA